MARVARLRSSRFTLGSAVSEHRFSDSASALLESIWTVQPLEAAQASSCSKFSFCPGPSQTRALVWKPILLYLSVLSESLRMFFCVFVCLFGSQALWRVDDDIDDISY